MTSSVEEKKINLKAKINIIENQIEEIGNLLVIIPNEIKSSRKKNKLNFSDLIDLEPKIWKLKKFYGDRLYNAIHKGVLNSLNTLAISCGYELKFQDLIEDKDTQSYMINFQTNEDVENANLSASSLKYIRINSSNSELKLNNEKRPLSVASAISTASWNPERKLEDGLLK
jgi:hypothetical protein